jgi:hypothetical protein
VWAALHRVLLERLHAAGELDWSRTALDSAAVPAKGGEAVGMTMAAPVRPPRMTVQAAGGMVPASGGSFTTLPYQASSFG